MGKNTKRLKNKKEKKALEVKELDTVVTVPEVTEIEHVLELPVLVKAVKTVETVKVTEPDEKLETATENTNVSTPLETSSDCVTEEEKTEVIETKQSKKEIEAEARDFKEVPEVENTEQERENETGEGTPSEVSPELEPANPTDVSKATASEEISAEVTTAKVEPAKVEKTKPRVTTWEEPQWLTNLIKKDWVKTHIGIKHPHTGENIMLHACNAFDTFGNPINVTVKGSKKVLDNLKKPSTKGLDKQAKDQIQNNFNVEIDEHKRIINDKKKAILKKIARELPAFLHLHQRPVWCWNSEKDRKLGIVGLAWGLQGGREKYTCLIDGFKADGTPSKIRRGYRFVSLTLPEGYTVPQSKPLEEATVVEARVTAKLLEDKRSKPIVYPVGYQTAIDNLEKPEKFHTILVWNSDGVQLPFYAVPADDEGRFKWLALEMSNMSNLVIHNDAIRMQGSVSELLRVTSLINQTDVDNLLIVSIQEDDFEGNELFLEAMGLGAVEGKPNGETQQREENK